MRSLLVSIYTALVAATPVAAAEILKLTTLEWPPYVLTDGTGPSTSAVKSAFSRAGIPIHIEVFPWNRAVTLAARDPEWIAVYPEYYSSEIDAEMGGDRCIFSKPFGISPVGFLTRKDSGFSWSTHADLTRYVIGVVRGYVNETTLDHMVASGRISAELAENDRENILKLLARRADAVVIDRHVYEYLVGHDPDLAGAPDALRFDPRLLTEHGLHVCFENSPADLAARDLFDAYLPELAQPDYEAADTGG